MEEEIMEGDEASAIKIGQVDVYIYEEGKEEPRIIKAGE